MLPNIQNILEYMLERGVKDEAKMVVKQKKKSYDHPHFENGKH